MMGQSLIIGNERWQRQIFRRTENSSLINLITYTSTTIWKGVCSWKRNSRRDGLANAAHVFTNREIQVLRTRCLLFGPQTRNIPITHVRIFAHRNKLRCLVSRQTGVNLSGNYAY